MVAKILFQRSKYRRNRLHFLWALPVAWFLTVPAQFIAALSLCGISGCSGGGFGRSTPDFPSVFGGVLISGMVLAIPVLAIPWTQRWAHRLTLAIFIAFGFAALLFLLIDQRPGDLKWDFSGRH